MSIALSQLGQLIEEIDPVELVKIDEELKELDNFSLPEELERSFEEIWHSWDTIKNIPLLVPEEERSLFQALKKDPSNLSVRNKITEHNLRLVAYWAARIKKSYPTTTLEFLDLCQEGAIGLMLAVTRFKLEKGFKFSTYASWGIRQRIIRAIENNGSGIRLPVYTKGKIKKFLITKKELTEKLGQEPSDEEIAKRMIVSLERITTIKKAIALRIISLDEPYVKGGESGYPLLDFIPDPRQNTEETAEVFFRREAINRALEILAPREREVITLRYGLGNETHPQSLEDVGRELGLTRQWISKIEIKAFRKLRESPETRQLLKDFVK